MGNGKLTVKMVRAINRPGMYGDGNTLYLNVAPGGSKQWIQRLTIHGKRHDIGLDVSHKAAYTRYPRVVLKTMSSKETSKS